MDPKVSKVSQVRLACLVILEPRVPMDSLDLRVTKVTPDPQVVLESPAPLVCLD